jgi:NADH-quinone oxidoreductase subunit J
VSGYEVVFAAFAAVAVAAALLSVTSRHIVHAALWLVVALGSLAGVYLVLGAEIVALVQLLVYVGAVVVLVIFALMLTRSPTGIRTDLDSGPGQRAAAIVAGAGVAALVGGALMVAVGDTAVEIDRGRGSARAMGEAIFGGWLLPFELLSVLLLAALVGAIAVSRDRDVLAPRRPEPSEGREPAADAAVQGESVHAEGPG